MSSVTFGENEENPYRRRYTRDNFQTQEEYNKAKREYKGEARTGKRNSDKVNGFLHRGWDAAQLSDPGSGPILRSDTEFSREARKNKKWNAENLGRVIELTDPTSGEKKRVPLEEITEKTFNGDQLTLCDRMGQCAIYVLTAAGAALVAAKLAGVLGGKKSRRKRGNKSKRNKSKRNKSKRNKSKRNKSKKNRRRSIRRR
jgi:hypothetical protein